jgi:hypothetical protein
MQYLIRCRCILHEEKSSNPARRARLQQELRSGTAIRRHGTDKAKSVPVIAEVPVQKEPWKQIRLASNWQFLNKTWKERAVNKNVKNWYWEMEEADEPGSEPRTSVVEKLPSRTFAEVPCPASAGWFEGEIKAALHRHLTRPRGKLQAVAWGPEHAFVVDIAHHPASRLTAAPKEE